MHSNPNGANNTTSDPREQVMWDFYVESITQNRENAYEAAIKAGYEDSSAKKITVTRWFSERKDKLRRKEMLSDAEKVLKNTLKFKNVNEQGVVKTELLRIQTDVAKHITKTLGKNEGYSERTEHTGADGKDLPTPLLHVLHNHNGSEETVETKEEN